MIIVFFNRWTIFDSQKFLESHDGVHKLYYKEKNKEHSSNPTTYSFQVCNWFEFVCPRVLMCGLSFQNFQQLTLRALFLVLVKMNPQFKSHNIFFPIMQLFWVCLSSFFMHNSSWKFQQHVKRFVSSFNSNKSSWVKFLNILFLSMQSIWILLSSFILPNVFLSWNFNCLLCWKFDSSFILHLEDQ
jgi:hypothetical protein